MTELEILAQLKMSYRYIDDIIDNADGTQIKSTEDLREVLKILEAKYEEVYQKIKNNDKKSLYYEENLMIADSIYLDYMTFDENGEENYITYLDLIDNKYPWWEDNMFLTKF